MTQNTSSAVMQQRSEAHSSLDDFPTPPWATRALCENLRDRGLIMPGATVREPAANRGHMVLPLKEYFAHVDASDVHDYGAGYPVRDYLFGPDPDPVDWTISNPPFRLALQFIERARRSSVQGCAFILRSAFQEGQARHEALFGSAQSRPTIVLQFAERVIMHRAVLRDPAIEYFCPKAKMMKKPSTATAYCVLIWTAGASNMPSEIDWIPPCRKALERPGDYPKPPEIPQISSEDQHGFI